MKMGFRVKSACVAALFMFVAVVAGAFGNDAEARVSYFNYRGTPAKYVFFFIGDGMGLPQRTAAEKYIGRELLMNQLPAQGITTTTAADRFITGSAASATAMASGIKTNIGMVGMDPNQRKLKTIAHMAKEKGMKVGIVSSVSIDHATPAAFYSHVPKRGQYHYIDHFLAESGFDYFAGGGLKDPTGKRKGVTPKGDAVAKAKRNGYKIVTDRQEFLNLRPGGKVYAHNAWLQDSGALPYHMDVRTGKDITLSEFTQKGIELLDNPKGFFMMVEGGKIDWACHANDAKASIMNTIAFDESIAKAYEFYKKHPNETLIVVTGDHECGGLTLGQAGTKYEMHMDILKPQYVSFQRFTDEFLSLYRKECNEAGNCSFDNFKDSINFYFGLKFEGDSSDPLVVADYQEQELRSAFEKSMAGEEVYSKDSATKRIYGGYDPLAVAITHTLNGMAGLGWTSYKHTAVPVGTSAVGVGADIFNGYYDNTEIAKKIMSVLGVKPQVYYADSDQDANVKMAAAE